MKFLIPEEEGIINISRVFAVFSFLFGTLLFVGYYFFEYSFLLMIGFAFVVISVVVNTVFLIALIIKFFTFKKNKKKIITSIIIILLNIPIAFVYYSLVMETFAKSID